MFKYTLGKLVLWECSLHYAEDEAAAADEDDAALFRAAPPSLPRHDITAGGGRANCGHCVCVWSGLVGSKHVFKRFNAGFGLVAARTV